MYISYFFCQQCLKLLCILLHIDDICINCVFLKPGKLQTLDLLLARLKAGDHRVLIFTQMTRMLDILEQFLSYHGHRYLRLDGTTKVEQVNNCIFYG